MDTTRKMLFLPMFALPIMDAIANGAHDRLGLGDEGAPLLHQVLRRRVVVALNGGRPSNLPLRRTLVLVVSPSPLSPLLFSLTAFNDLRLIHTCRSSLRFLQ